MPIEITEFNLTHTARGFQLIEFLDRNEKECTLQQSSVADYTKPGSSALWLGVGENRMHLSQTHAEALIKYLTEWVMSGELFKE